MIVVKSLKEIASFIRTGKTPPTRQVEYFNGEINWYSPGDLDKTKFLFDAKRTITQLAIEDKKAITYPKNTLLIGCIGNIGKLGITSELSSSNQQLTGVLPNDNTDVNYLYYWFYGNKKVLESYSNNAVVPILNNRTLETIKIPLPPLDQQKKIAAILDAADAYRQKTKALITKYEELTQSLFLDMFGDPVSNPMGWEKESLYFCLQKVEKIGKDYSEVNIEYVDIGSVDNIRNIITETTTYKIQERPSRAQQILLSGDIIISTVRPNLKNIALNQVEGRIGSTGFFVCRTNLNKLSNFFLFKLMLTDSVTDYFVGITSGANYPAIKSNDLKKFLLVVPPIELQNQFADRVIAIETQKIQAQESLVQAEDLFNSLLQRAFKGELV
jgi:type I restriction enzyme S subunit